MWLCPAKSTSLLLTGLFFWLLFFPNAPYLLTELMHISSLGGDPFWFDLVLLLSFAWSGLMLGHLSLLEVHRIVNERFGLGYTAGCSPPRPSCWAASVSTWGGSCAGTVGTCSSIRTVLLWISATSCCTLCEAQASTG